MFSRFGASVSALALLFGLVAAPHTHLHESGHDVWGDGHHTRGSAGWLLHAHLTPHQHGHEHEEPAGTDEHGGPEILVVDNFVFRAAATPSWSSSAVLPLPVTVTPLTSVWLGVQGYQPPAHGPPPALPPASRAPPSLLPAAT